MKYKIGDIVKVKNSVFELAQFDGEIMGFSNKLYQVKFEVELVTDYQVRQYFWFFENELELVKPIKKTFGDGTNNDLIAEIKNYQHKINILLNRLESNLND